MPVSKRIGGQPIHIEVFVHAPRRISAACTAHRAMSQRTGGTVAFFDCFSGIAGDMALGALIDAVSSSPTHFAKSVRSFFVLGDRVICLLHW